MSQVHEEALESAQPSLRALLSMALAPFLVSRSLLWVTVALSLSLFPIQLAPGQWRIFSDLLWLDGWARWDSAWYATVYLEGYHYVPGHQCNAAFFPLYPYLTGIVSRLLAPILSPHHAFHLTGIVVSNVGFLIGLAGLARLGHAWVGPDATRRALWLACFYPFSFFFSAVYAEGVYFALIVWAFAFGHAARWNAAFFTVGLAALTRPHGITAAMALGVQYAWQTGFPRRRLQLRDGVALWPVLAFCGVLLMHHVSSGEALAFLKAQSVWRDRLSTSGFWSDLQVFFTGDLVMRVQYGVALLVLATWVLLAVPLARRFGPGYGLLTLMSVGLTGYSCIEALGRYASVAFPIYLLAGERLRSRFVYNVTLGVSAVLLLFLGVAFARWLHVT
ncbi:MAG: hypothetical protein EB084_23515 [Proteobacteria bacterium]|nr:hypothetical protein [Pseudomonadota bacterium]